MPVAAADNRLKVAVIILAQGTQQRMGAGFGPKQLLPLPACDNVPIIARTFRQVDELAVRDIASKRVATWLVSWSSVARGIREYAAARSCGVEPPNDRNWSAWRRIKFPLPPHVELPDPGNSSLKGIARVLENSEPWADMTIVLLGDVVYSWRCLEALWSSSGLMFVGTSDLSHSSGELWGVAWSSDFDDSMIVSLREALSVHPPYSDTYQPGQLRRWITGSRRGVDPRDHAMSLGAYTDIDDYTMDVDLPVHVPMLGPTSRAAASDDARHGIVWTAPKEPG